MDSIAVFLAIWLAAEAPPATPDPREEAIFKGEVKFQKPESGELYRQALADLKDRMFAEAEKASRKGKSGISEKAEAEVFERLIREARAGQDLERIQKMARPKGAGPAALRELGKAIERARGLRLLEDLRRLEKEIQKRVFYLVEDFESASEGAEAEKDGGTAGKSRRKGSLGRYGEVGKVLEAKTAGGEIQEAGADRSRVRQGLRSYRWAVGKDLHLKILEIETGALPRYGFLDFSLRGAAGKSAVVTVSLLPEDPDWTQFFLGKARGYIGSAVVKGEAWKDFRMSLDRDFIPREAPEKGRIAYIVLSVKNQPEQVIYLDDVKLEE